MKCSWKKSLSRRNFVVYLFALTPGHSLFAFFAPELFKVITFNGSSYWFHLILFSLADHTQPTSSLWPQTVLKYVQARISLHEVNSAEPILAAFMFAIFVRIIFLILSCIRNSCNVNKCFINKASLTLFKEIFQWQPRSAHFDFVLVTTETEKGNPESGGAGLPYPSSISFIWSYRISLKIRQHDTIEPYEAIYLGEGEPCRCHSGRSINQAAASEPMHPLNPFHSIGPILAPKLII